ncbi:carbamoyltransferase HypF, partial [candidate division KSB1 bacterium]
VQHHHAHIASCLAENHYTKKVIGLAMDGTGYGTDGAVWGGEILIADISSFKRVGHFLYRPIPGGDSAIKNIWRMAAGYIYHLFTDKDNKFDKNKFLAEWSVVPHLNKIPSNEIDIVLKMIQNRVNTPLTSSLGRLFDAVAAIAGIRSSVSYEGQAAIELEAAMNGVENDTKEEYIFDVIRSEPVIINPDPVIARCLEDAGNNVPAHTISYRFHNAVVEVLVKVCVYLRDKHRVSTTALSGGCFQNKFLLEKLTERLINEGFEVLNHALVPVNDGGISLGQAVVAAGKLSK